MSGEHQVHLYSRFLVVHRGLMIYGLDHMANLQPNLELWYDLYQELQQMLTDLPFNLEMLDHIHQGLYLQRLVAID